MADDLTTAELEADGGARPVSVGALPPPRDVPTEGLILVEPFATMVADGSKPIVVKSRPLKISGRPMLLVTGDRALGVVTLSKPREIGVDEFQRTSDLHGIDEAARKKFWPGRRRFWAYRVVRLQVFGAPLKIARQPGARVLIRDVEFKSDGFALFDVEKSGARGGEMDTLTMHAEGLEKRRYPGLKMPSPEFNLSRLREGKPTGLLSRVERAARVGVEQVLVNELIKPEDTPLAFAVVTIGDGKKYAGIGALPSEVAEGLDEFTRREFQAERSFWYHEFAVVKDFGKPVPLSKPAPGRRFAGEVDVRGRGAEPAESSAADYGDLPDPFEDDGGRPRAALDFEEFAEPAAKYVAVMPGASGPYRVARLKATDDESAAEEAGELGALRELDAVALAQKVGVGREDRPVYKVLGTVRGIDEDVDIARAVEGADPVRLRGATADEVLGLADTLRRFHRMHFEGQPTTVVNAVSREDALNAYVFVVRELRRRGEVVEPSREIDSEAMDLDSDLFKDDVEKAQPFGTFGGSHHYAKRLLPLIPDHKTYVEPFAGAAALLHVKEPVDKEVIADADDNVVFLHRSVKAMTTDRVKELSRRFEWACTQQSFAKARDMDPKDEVARFYKLVFVRTHARDCRPDGTHPAREHIGSTTNPEKYLRAAERLKAVTVLRQDYRKTITQFDSLDTFFFIDPPYPGEWYDKNAVIDLDEFVKTLRSIKGRYIAVLNDSPENVKAFKSAGHIFRLMVREASGTGGAKNASRLFCANFQIKKRTVGKSIDDDVSNLSDNDILEFMVPADESAKAVGEGDGRECAPTHPSGEKLGRRIFLDEVLEKIRPFRFRQDALTIVGGIANRGWTDNDIDVLIKGPLDEDTLHVLKFRFGRMLGPELAQRVQFLDDSLGGPMTDHVPLGNLMFETAPEFTVKEMREPPVGKQDDPLQDLPLEPGKLDAVVALHARGKTVHLDLRIKVRDYLTGWTLPLQREGAIKDPITTVAQLKEIAKNYDVETGNKFLKPMLAPKGLFATPKPRHPVAWLGIEDRVFPPGSVGATKEHVGVIIAIDRPKVEFGQVSPRFAEYFVTDSKLKNGIWFARQLVGEETEVSEEEEGRVTPAGEVFWKFSISKQFLPSILKPRTVARGTMPPDGWSWIPQSLERDATPEFGYWTKKGAEARRARDALVEERVFTERTVGLVDGEFRLVREKRFVVNDGTPVGVVEKQPKRAPYALSRQSFRGPVVVRGGFSKVFWWLVLDDPDGKGVRAWRVQTDPLSGEERMSAVEASADETRDKALLELSGDQPPGSRWNPTKATPSDVRRVGEGSAELLEEKAGFLRLRFLSGPLRGVWTLAAEEPGSLLWELSVGSVPGVPMDKARGEGMGVGGPPTQDGGADSCVCPSCGITVPHTRGIPCVEVACPKCGLAMVGGTAKAGVPTRDGVQIWDPDKKRPDADRTDLRPLANFVPMKPREGFFDPNELIGEWATPEIVAAGLDTEPKLNGLHTIAEVDGRGRTFIYFEDSRDDRSEILPGVAAGVKALGEKVGPFILDAELLDFDEDGNAQPRRTLSRFTGPVQPQDDSRVKLMAFRLVYGLGRNWTADPRSDARPALEKFFEKAGRLEHLELIPFKTVGSVDEIPGLVKWATEQPGGEGALFKMHESTYTLGRFTSSWSKLKIARSVRAVVVEKIPKTPSPGQKIPARTFVYRCAVGPISKKALDNFGSLVQIHGEWYTEIGKTFATNVQAGVGQTLEVQATEFLVDLSGEKKTVHWFTPVVAARTDERPSTFDEVVDATFEHEIKRAVEKFLDGPVRVLKAESSDEERIVCGVVLEPRTDSQEDFASKDEIRRAAYEYMEFYRGTGLMHRERIFGGRVRICESWVQRGDTEIGGQPVFDGSWLMTWRLVDDGLWADAKSKKLGGFSIQGSAVREPIK